MRKAIIILCAVAAAFVAGTTYASIANLGFESGIAGWAINSAFSGGDWGVTPAFQEPTPQLYFYNYTPVEGTNLLYLGAGTVSDINTGTPVPTVASRSFTAVAGEIIQGSAAFGSGEEYNVVDGEVFPSLFNDWAKVRISGANGYENIPFATDVNSVIPVGYSEWAVWTWTAPQAGTFLIEYMVANDTDPLSHSYAVFDAAPVPLPPSVLLLAPGLLGLWGLRRRSSRQ